MRLRFLPYGCRHRAAAAGGLGSRDRDKINGSVKEGNNAFARYRDIDEDIKKEIVNLL